MKICTTCKKRYQFQTAICPDDGTVLEPDFSYLVNTTLDGQYQIEAMLGQGGMGAVYRARHTLLGDLVAIKIIRPDLANQSDYLKRFLREGQAARRFRHNNSVIVYDLRNSPDGLLYMVLEYIEGHTLKVEMEKCGRMTPAQAFALIEPVASALNSAHAVGVVHRDLKPENIMIGKEADGSRVLKILDLGLAKINPLPNASEAALTRLTSTGQLLGTPYYMSPEQWGFDQGDTLVDSNKQLIIDGRADIYSLGLIVYEMVAGRRPFDAKTLESLALQHAMTIPTPLKEIDKSVPSGFSDAVARAIAKRRGDRQQTMAEFVKQMCSGMAPDTGPIAHHHHHRDPLQREQQPAAPRPVDRTIAYVVNRYVVIRHLSGSRANQVDEFPLENLQEITIGRDPCAMVRYDPFRDDLVGRQQAKIIRDQHNPMQFLIVDLNSRNGTFVNKQRIFSPTRINAGDTVSIGKDGPVFEFFLR